jgi:hypothetical protein
MRMVWFGTNYNEPKFELVRLVHGIRHSLRARNRVGRPAESRVEADRWMRQKAAAGRLGEWPKWRKAKRRVAW